MEKFPNLFYEIENHCSRYVATSAKANPFLTGI